MTPSMPFEIPESVRVYLTEDDLRAAVDLLADFRANHRPGDLALVDYLPFLEARAAAVLTRAEHAVTVLRFWQYVWGAAFPEWTPMPMDEQNYASEKDIWEHGEITIYLQGPGIAKNTLYLIAGLSAREVRIAFALEDQDEEPLFTQSHEEWKYFEDNEDEDYPGYFVKRWKTSIVDPAFPWDELQASRDAAVTMMKDRLSRL